MEVISFIIEFKVSQSFIVKAPLSESFVMRETVVEII